MLHGLGHTASTWVWPRSPPGRKLLIAAARWASPITASHETEGTLFHPALLQPDGAHAAGCEYKGKKIGAHGNTVAFSFYATKNLTTGEGGMITTADAESAARMRRLALHGMSRDAWKRYTQTGSCLW